MSLSQRFAEIRSGFEPPFWVANVSELFERLAYYAAFASLARYLNESLGFDLQKASGLTGLFGGLVWFLAVFGGTLADRLGFRRALSIAYLILTVAYFSLGSIKSAWLAPVRDHIPLTALVTILVMLPALGIALVKPSVVGTTARASKPNVRSIGYSIYYTLVNIGGAAGPYVASYVHQHMKVESVFRVAALCVFAMFFAVLLFFREPSRKHDEAQTTSIAQAGRNFLTVLSNGRFVLFLLIFTGYWIAYWQEFIILPTYLVKYVDPKANTELLLVTGPLVVIALTLVFGFLTQKMPAFRAVIVGTLVSGAAWLLLAFHPSVGMAVVTLFAIAIGELTQSPRYYDYISRLAPPGQQGTYMGFAFLPIGIGSLIGGVFGGFLLHHFGEVTHHPSQIWIVVAAVGVATAVLLWVYDRTLGASREGASTGGEGLSGVAPSAVQDQP